MFCKKNDSPEATFNIVSSDVKAPVEKGQKVGCIEVYKDGVLYKTVDVVAAEGVKKASYGDRIKEVADGWSL